MTEDAEAIHHRPPGSEDTRMDIEEPHWHVYLKEGDDKPAGDAHRWLLSPASSIKATFPSAEKAHRWMLNRYIEHAGDIARPSSVWEGALRGRGVLILEGGGDVVWSFPRRGRPGLVIAAICCPNRVDLPCPLAQQDQPQSC
ncbi:hypothetical protein ACFWYW_58140 [Nonomuraea sp. NPDC059023]|uniref:hypothetical protein n=1 Tax=unclassified Nonomuraea TaxID=2593643 RepID=UPI0036B2E6CE